MGKTGWVDLGNGKIAVKQTDRSLLHRFLGGRGIGAAILYDTVGPDVKSLDPKNVLVFSTGAFTGTAWPASARYHVTFKSPATDAYGYANAGGYFGPILRRAGFDALVISGRSPEPVVLHVQDHALSLVPAAHLWGLTTSQTESMLVEQGGGSVACIGPAGENLVRMAAIINDGGRAAARGGPGAVMGSKNLKAVHVCTPTRKVDVPASFRRVAGEKARQVAKHPNVKPYRDFTTMILMTIQNAHGSLPAKNHQVAGVPFIEQIDHEAIGAYWIEQKGCHACPIQCARTSQVRVGDELVSLEGPEYESANALGPMVWNGDPDVILRANYLCNELGLDTISTGVTIAFAMELHERGLLDSRKFSLEWGDPETILGLAQAIAERDDVGHLLAEGTRRAAEAIGAGAIDSAMQVKGLEMPRQEPRKAKAFGLGHATSNRGADHLYALPTIDTAANWNAAKKIFPEEILQQLMDPADETYKPDLVVYSEHFCAVVDALGVCKFTTPETYTLTLDDLAEGLQAMGSECSGDDLLLIGERIVNLERLYNVRHGLGARDDTLPPRFTQEKLPVYLCDHDAGAGEWQCQETVVDSGAILDLQSMLRRYYILRGWSQEGIPTQAALERLGLSDYWKD